MFGEYAVNLINVSDEVHDDGVEPAPVRQVVPLLYIDPQQFVAVEEEQMVTEKFRKSSLLFHVWRQKY